MKATTYSRGKSLESILEQALAALLLGFVLFFGLLITALVGFQLYYAGSIFPGVRVAGIDVGGLTSSAAVARVTSQFQFPQNGHVLFRDGSQTWLVTPAEMGLFFDPQATVQEAYAVGRSGGALHSLKQQIETWYNGVDMSPAFVFDQRIARQYLANLAAGIDRPTQEASLSLQGTEVLVRPGETGRTVDIDATLTALSGQMMTLQDGVVPLLVKETPPSILDASRPGELARTILSKPLTLTLPEGQSSDKGPWVIQPETLAGMLSIERAADQSSGFQVGINPSLMRTYLGNLAPSLDVTPSNARFMFNDESKQLEVLEKSVTGRTLDIEASIQAVQAQIEAGKHSVPLVFKTNKPAVEDTASGESLGITELVHAQTSYFYGSSAARIQNIEASAARFHGVLVPPDSTFSMAAQLGDISLDNGYAEAMIIIGGRTIKGVGGGVCQVSTTLFRTAFFAGYPIVERNAHAYRVYYYEKVAGNRIDPSLAGLDATVFVPLVDFKFRNDTPNWLLMETYVNPENSSITWKFYSTKDGRSVDWETTGPVDVVEPPEPEYHENPDLGEGEIKQVDWQAQGADVTVNRTVTRDGSVYIQDTYHTHYEPWADVYEYGPGTELPKPGDTEDGG